MKLLKTSFKTEIAPTLEQTHTIRCELGSARFVYNRYLAACNEAYETTGEFLDANAYSKNLNEQIKAKDSDIAWLKERSSKSTKEAIANGERAFKNFFKGNAGYPNFKKKGRDKTSFYFVRNGKKKPIVCERWRIKVPTLGWVKLKEKGYLPTSKSGISIISGHITEEAGRFYISVCAEVPAEDMRYSDTKLVEMMTDGEAEALKCGLGIDVGIKDTAIVSNRHVYKNINYERRIKKLESRLKHEQRALARKYEAKKKGNPTTYRNIDKQRLKIQRLNQRLTNIRTDYQNKIVCETVKTKPAFITMETLNVKGMMKNHHLAKSVANQKLSSLHTKMQYKCKLNGVQFRTIGQWYPSSKKCHNCGHVKKDLKLSDRKFVCPSCGYEEDRDFNASLNIRDAKEFDIAS